MAPIRAESPNATTDAREGFRGCSGGTVAGTSTGGGTTGARLLRSIYLIGWTESRRGDPFFTFSEPQYLHHYYIEQALGINQADAVGILKFLALMGHGVGYPTEGTW